ncbi:cell wall hydrolase [Effusibacillus dendaii]|uniref:Cell wall hydrolase SleB domain-containing protein n=1 Tax=Effusibacillus dendaii TaxID=2743772 RepID=A0A7I8DHS4_9BACL|nr:cell wall hydrolase [Effusibacillus dendaii]BCJ88476.1 hypothetical protein skT53_34610 [Effusibacillus dendaii]
MREQTAMMTLVMTVVVALTVRLGPDLMSNQTGIQPAGAIHASSPVAVAVAADNRNPVEGSPAATPVGQAVEQSTAETAEQKEQNPANAGVLSSRSGLLQNQQPAYTEEDLYWLAHVISSEAKGESLEGQIAVGAVVVNRVRDPHFPKTIKDVIFAKGQFDPVREETIYNEPSSSAVEAAKRVLAGENPVPDALYFYNPNTATDPWIRNLRVVARIGNHAFAAR